MYRLRFIYVLLKSIVSPSKNLLSDFTLDFMAVPLIDTDYTRLFTQTYSLYMGLARWNFLFNSEFKTAALKKAWVPVTTSETITYKKSIKAFSHVKLVTRMLHWNERRFYLEHVFYVNGQVCAHAYVEGLVRSPAGHLKPTEVFTALGITRESPPMPEKMQGWVNMLSAPNAE